MEIILFEPEIPPNTGNISRFCAGMDLPLNLIEPLGFSLDDKHLKRAGLDYWPLVNIHIWPNWPGFLENWTGGNLVGTSARQGRHFSGYIPKKDDGLVFGPETRGLPDYVLKDVTNILNIPLKPGVRSLNLSTTVGFIMGVALSKLSILEGKI